DKDDPLESKVSGLFCFLEQLKLGFSELCRFKKMKQAYIKLHIALILAGFTGIFGKLITLNAALISWYRLFFSALIMLLFFAVKGKFAAIANSAKLKISFTGLLLGIHWILF